MKHKFFASDSLPVLSSHPTKFVKSLDTTLPEVAQGSLAGSSQIKYRRRRRNTAVLKHKIHQKCMKLTWGGEYGEPESAWEPEIMSRFSRPALTQRFF